MEREVIETNDLGNKISNNRKLASIQRIIKIEEHRYNKSKVILTVLGWKVVADKKDNFTVNQLIVFFEIDCLLKKKQWNHFLKEEGYCVTVRNIDGEISEGLVSHISIIKDYELDNNKNSDIEKIIDINSLKEGDDLTKYLEVVKYCDDSEIQVINRNIDDMSKIEDIKNDTIITNNKNENTNIISSKQIKDNLKVKINNDSINSVYSKSGKPLQIPIQLINYDADSKIKYKNATFPLSTGLFVTQEPRIQSNPSILKFFEGKPYIACLKYDGVSVTFLLKNNKQEKSGDIVKDSNINSKENSINTIPSNTQTQELVVCSRNFIRTDKNDIYCQIALKYNIEKILISNPGISLQGEIYGKDVLDNKQEEKETKLVIFNIYDSSINKYLDYNEIELFCSKNNLDIVEKIEEGDSFKYSIEELQEKTKGYYKGTTNQREGLVYRLKTDWFNIGKARTQNKKEKNRKDKNNDNSDDDIRNSKNVDKKEVAVPRYSFKIVNNEYLSLKHPSN